MCETKRMQASMHGAIPTVLYRNDDTELLSVVTSSIRPSRIQRSFKQLKRPAS